MPRPREFEIEAALDRALEVFWTRGYDATSLDDLQRAMRLSRSSIYTAFGAKHALFLACLERYTRKVGAALSAGAAQPLPASRLLDRLITTVLELTSVGGGSRGCFLGNTSLELGGRDPVARRRVRSGLRAVEGIFAQVVRRGIAEGEFRTTVQPARAAQFLTSGLQGILVMAKTGANRTTLAALRKAILSAVTR
jgi:TetR/AcrR family transcriptional regulator, transcriptional repressor for nem operon